MSWQAIEGEKQCKRCGECKPVSMFSRLGDGWHSYCKQCRSRYQNVMNKRKTKRSAGPRPAPWPRPVWESLADNAVDSWRGPVNDGPLVATIGRIAA